MRYVNRTGCVALSVSLLLISCARETSSPQPKARPASRAIFKGQPWRDARAVATAAGYRINDARGLEWASPGPDGEAGPDGFYIALPDDTILIVFRDRSSDRVDQLALQGHTSQPKRFRTYPKVGDSFELPARAQASAPQ